MRYMRHVAKFLLVIVLAAAVTACGSRPASLLPKTGEAPDWEKTEETRQFAADNLWKYLDGGAERYRQAGVRVAVTAGYRYRGTVEAVADIYIMRSAGGARTIFETESASGSRPIVIGDAGRSFGQSITFCRGRYLVRLVAFEDTAGTEKALLALAQAIDARLR